MKLLKMQQKPFPLCRYNHQTLDLVIDYQKENNIDTKKISSITIDMPKYGVQLCGSPIEQKGIRNLL